MGDILDRLRKRKTSHDLHYAPDAMSQDAADEIERLRTALYKSDEGCNYMHMYDEAHEAAKEGSQDG